MTDSSKAGLFGIQHSNRDFSSEDSWGKNQFNSSFPIALGCYLYSKNLKAVYITLDNNLDIKHKQIGIDELYGGNPIDGSLEYDFEMPFDSYRIYVSGAYEKDDVVIKKFDTKKQLKCVEIKLTALPDNSTFSLSEDKYSCELVVRQPTIMYLACGIINRFQTKKDKLKQLIGTKFDGIIDWNNQVEIKKYLLTMKDTIYAMMKSNPDVEEPIIMEPIWKTKGKSQEMPLDCLDVFVWSNFALIKLFSKDATASGNVTRQERSLVWLIKMLLDYTKSGTFNYAQITDNITLGNLNDKAFASNGKATYDFLKCAELTSPRIKSSEINNIILGNGVDLLSPERRFDAVIQFNAKLAKEKNKNESN